MSTGKPSKEASASVPCAAIPNFRLGRSTPDKRRYRTSHGSDRQRYTETGSTKSKTMNEVAVFALFSVPLLGFVSAAMLEFRRDHESLRRLTRMLPIVVAVVVSIVLLIDVHYPYLSFRLRLSRTMSAVSLLVALSALVCRYKSRLTAALVFMGGLVLAMFWLINRWVS